MRAVMPALKERQIKGGKPWANIQDRFAARPHFVPWIEAVMAESGATNCGLSHAPGRRRSVAALQIIGAYALHLFQTHRWTIDFALFSYPPRTSLFSFRFA